jgi:hypothetical protein
MEINLLEGTENLVEKWGKALDGINDPYVRKVTAVLFENQAKHILLQRSKALNEDLSAGATTVGNLGTFQKWAFPLVRRVYPNLIANEVCSQQPMQGPVSQVFYLGYGRQFGATRQNLYSKYALTYKNMVTSGVGSKTLNSATSPGLDLDLGSGFPLSSVYGANYGTPSTTFGGQIAMWPADGTVWPKATHALFVSTGEYLTGTGIPEVNLSIEQQPVTARTRKMRALWSIEASQDLKAYHGLDLEGELTDLLSNELKLELDRELIEDLRGIAYDASIANGLGGFYRNILDLTNSNSFPAVGGADNYTPSAFMWTWNANYPLASNPQGSAKNVFAIDFTASSMFPGMAPQHIGQVWANLLGVLNLASQDIYKTTHRGPGTWLITSPLIGALLETAAQMHGGVGGESRVTGPTNMGTNITFKGKVFGKYDLYIDPLYPDDEILMGYKGNAMDGGFIYCPYIPLEMLPNVVDPETFQPRKGIMTRYGKIAITPEARFYRVIRIVGPTAGYLINPYGQNNTNVAATVGVAGN